MVSPFQIQTRQLTLKARDRKPMPLGPKVRIETVRSSTGADPKALVQSAGLGDWDKDGFPEMGTATTNMWLEQCSPSLHLEFELPEPVTLGAIEVWNYNGEWQTGEGLRQADIAVSTDGTTWQTLLRAVEVAEAEGTTGYDQPAVIKLNGVSARKVRLENLVPWNAGKQVGLSKVVFHELPGKRAGVLRPEDGAIGVDARHLSLEWLPGENAREHRLFLGTDPARLESLGSTKEPRFQPADLKPDAGYHWRVDELQPDGSTVASRVWRFTSAGLVGWWKLDQTSGTEVVDTTAAKHVGLLKGKANWQPAAGPVGGALEFDGQGTYIDFGTAEAFDLQDAVTVSVWVKVRAFDKPWQAVLAKGEDGWRLRRRDQDDVLTFDCNGLTTKSGDRRVGAAARRAVTDNQWHHVVGLYDGTQLAFYQDGQLESATPATGQISQNRRPLLVGKDFNRTDRSWNGWLADLRIYGYALTPDEVKAIYRAGQKTERAEK